MSYLCWNRFRCESNCVGFRNWKPHNRVYPYTPVVTPTQVTAILLSDTGLLTILGIGGRRRIIFNLVGESIPGIYNDGVVTIPTTGSYYIISILQYTNSNGMGRFQVNIAPPLLSTELLNVGNGTAILTGTLSLNAGDSILVVFSGSSGAEVNVSQGSSLYIVKVS